MIKNKYFPTLVTGFAAAVLSSIPGLKGFAFFFLFPAAILIAVWLSQKIQNLRTRISAPEALLYGLFTGISLALFSTLFEIVSTYFTKSHEMITLLPQLELTLSQLNLGETAKQSIELLRGFGKEISASGFSLFFSLFLLFNNLFSNVVFGLIFGLVSMLIHNARISRS
ncbi:MAG: hypothetical protein AB9882_05780 [Ignavibacteriaceae bacterium]